MVLVTILTIFFIIVAAALVLIVLVQRPQGGGLSGAFGGAGGGSDTVFGGRTGDALTLATVIFFVLFLGLSIGLNVIDVKQGSANAADTAADVADGGAPVDPLSTPAAPTTQTIPIGPGGLQPSNEPGAPTIRRVDPSEVPGLLPQSGQPGTTPAQPPTQEPGAQEPQGDGTQPE